MKLIIDEQIVKNYPQVSFGVIICKTVDNVQKTFALEQLFNGLSAQVQNKLRGISFSSIPKISNWQNVYQDITAKTYETNMEKVLRSVTKKKEIPFTDNLSKIRDYFMVKWQLPIICFSLNDVYGDIQLTYKNKDVVYKDQGSDLTRKWNSEQLERGDVNRETLSCVYIIENLGILSAEDLSSKMEELAQMVQKYCMGAGIEFEVLGVDKLETGLGIEGLKEFEVIDEPETEIAVSRQIPELTPEEESETISVPEVKESYEAKTVQAPEPKPTQKPVPPQIEQKEDTIDQNSLKIKIRDMLQEALDMAFPDIIEKLNIEYPRDSEHGDYACSIAMKLSKTLGQNPLEIAQKIKSNIQPLQFVDSIEVVQPGFINIKLLPSFLAGKVNEIAETGALYDSKLANGRTVVIDYSSPNIAKPLGVHHLLSTVIGQAVYNIYKALGYETIGVNHLGDWGTQFGKLIYAFKEWGDKKTIEKDPIPELLKLYVKYHDEAENDNTLDDKAREEFKKLETDDAENKQLWEWFVELSIHELVQTYAKLGVEFDEYIGESFYNDKMAAIIEEGKQKGVFTEGEGGALIVEFEDENMSPYLIRKSDGTTLYSTRDLATIKYRLERWNPEQLLYVVDSSQSLHFKQLFETAKRLGYDSAKFEHISFGRMSMPDKAMSTRKGNIVLLDEVIGEGIERASVIVKEKSKDLKKREQDMVSQIVALGAIKYNILHQNRTTDIVFDWSKMLSVEGNSAPYLQYTYARAESILRKAESAGGFLKKVKKKAAKPEPTEEQIDLFQAIEKVEDDEINAGEALENPHELAVARLLVKFQEYLVIASEEYKPNLFAQYLYDLAQNFNGFYNSVPVLQTENEELKESRLKLTKAVSTAIKEGLGILGIDVPERM